MFSRSFEEMGIPPGYGFKQLLFSRVANVLVAQMQSAGNKWRPERLFFRHSALDKYQQVGAPADFHSQESVKAGLLRDRSQVDYVIAELDVTRRMLKPTVSLPAVFI
jgi:hypothetical protein